MIKCILSVLFLFLIGCGDTDDCDHPLRNNNSILSLSECECGIDYECEDGYVCSDMYNECIPDE